MPCELSESSVSSHDSDGSIFRTSTSPFDNVYIWVRHCDGHLNSRSRLHSIKRGDIVSHEKLDQGDHCEHWKAATVSCIESDNMGILMEFCVINVIFGTEELSELNGANAKPDVI